MTEGPPVNRCGYAWPEDHRENDDPDRQSCCYREVWNDTDRCIWHADSEVVGEKPVDRLRAARAPAEIRELNAPVTELLDGAELADQTLGDKLPFHGVRLRESNFSGASLEGADFSETNLEGGWNDQTDFSETRLERAEFSGARIRYVDFSDAVLREVDISETDISERYHADELSNRPVKWHAKVNFEDADLTGIDGSEAMLWRANLSGTDLTDATLTGARICQAYLEDATLLRTALNEADLRCTDFTKASVTHSDFSEASLGGSNLSTTDLEGNTYSHTTLFGAELPEGFSITREHSVYLTIPDLVRKEQLSRRAKQHLSNTYLPDADFSEYSLTGADLSGAFLPRAKIGRAREADFSLTSLRDADLSGPPDSDSRFTKNGSDFVGSKLNGANLSGVNLSEASLRFATLTDADLSEATLTDADISNAYLKGATFAGARLRDSEFTGASYYPSPSENPDEYRPDFSSTEIGGADFSETELPEADFKAITQGYRADEPPTFAEASLRGADFSEADLTGADLTDVDAVEISFRAAYLNGADFLSGDFSWGDFTEAVLIDADLSGSDLTGANLSQAWVGEAPDEPAADLSEAILEDAGLPDAYLVGVDFTAAHCKDADFKDANLERAIFDDAVLQEGSFISADCERASFRDAVLIRVSMEGADLTGANLAGAYLFGATIDGVRIDSETQFTAAGPVGDPTVSQRIRYDTDAPPDTPEESLAAERSEPEGTTEDLLTVQLRQAASVYRRLEELARQNGYPTLQSAMFKRRQEMRRQFLRQNGERREWLFAEVQRWVFVYGESFSRILSISALVIGLFWLVYLTSGTVKQMDGTSVTVQTIAEHPSVIVTSLFHSVSVFFTGDPLLEATGRVGEFIMVLESMAGPILLALLVFVLGRRAAR